MIVRCQALRPGSSSRHLHSTQPRTWQARFVDFRTAQSARYLGARDLAASPEICADPLTDVPAACAASHIRPFPLPLPTMASLISFISFISFVATQCDDQVFLWRWPVRAVFLLLGCKKVTARGSPRLLERHKAAIYSCRLDSGIAEWVAKRQKRCLLSDVPAAKSRCSLRAVRDISYVCPKWTAETKRTMKRA